MNATTYIHDDRTTGRLAVLRTIDEAAYDTLIDSLPWLAEYLGADSDLADLADLTIQIAAEDSEAANAFVNRISAQPMIAVDATGLRRWALHGLQRYRGDPVRRLRHFDWGDTLVFSDRQTRSDTEYLLENRRAFLHYLAGYGFDGFAIDLHEPQPVDASALAPGVNDGVIRFPRRFDHIGAADRGYFFRAALAHIAAHLLHSPMNRAVGNRRPSLVIMTALVEDARVERLMVRKHPGLHALWGRFHTASKQSSGFDFGGLAARLSRALHDPAYEDPNPWVCKGRELFEEAAAADLGEIEAFDRLARTLTIDLGKMRLAPPTGYRPAPVYRDDNALLWAPDAALPEDEEREAEIDYVEHSDMDDGDASTAERVSHRRYHYPEWDHRTESLRESWTTVLEPVRSQKFPAAANFVAVAPKRPALGAERTPDRSIRLKRLSEGDELDLNAVVENATQQRAAIAPDGRIFSRHGRRRRSTAIVLLMDLSVSTDRFVPGSFTKVLDLEKQAARVVVEALDPHRDRIAVHGFASNGRHEVNYQRVKDFDEPFDAPQQARLAALTSGLSTRMGAAVRHATAALANEQADHKVILLLTDGEPSDVDVMEEEYLVEDARQAVVGAASLRVHTFCLTLDRRADGYVRRIFGKRNYLIAERAATFTHNTSNTLMRLLAP